MNRRRFLSFAGRACLGQRDRRCVALEPRAWGWRNPSAFRRGGARWAARLARAALRGRRALQHGPSEYRARRAFLDLRTMNRSVWRAPKQMQNGGQVLPFAPTRALPRPICRPLCIEFPGWWSGPPQNSSGRMRRKTSRVETPCSARVDHGSLSSAARRSSPYSNDPARRYGLSRGSPFPAGMPYRDRVPGSSKRMIVPAWCWSATGR
jgi:hypothetical protein